MLLGFLDGCVMKTDDRSMHVEVRVYSAWISYVARQTKILGEKHENAGEFVVQLTMSLPELAVDNVLRFISGLGAMNVIHYFLENTAHNDGTSKSRVTSTLEDIIHEGGRFFPAINEGVF